MLDIPLFDILIKNIAAKSVLHLKKTGELRPCWIWDCLWFARLLKLGFQLGRNLCQILFQNITLPQYLRIDQTQRLVLVLLYFLMIQTFRNSSGCPKHAQCFGGYLCNQFIASIESLRYLKTYIKNSFLSFVFDYSQFITPSGCSKQAQCFAEIRAINL